MRPASTLLAVGLLAASCTGTAGGTTTTTTLPPTDIEPVATDRLLTELELESLAGLVADLRRLEFIRPVQVSILDDDDYRARVDVLTAPPLDIDPDQADSWLRLLGALPDGSNVSAATGRLLQYGSAIHDPATAQVLVRAGAGVDPFVESAVVGELMHLLLAQNFATPDPVLLTGERGYVYRAIVEGDVLRIRQRFIGELDDDDEFRYELGRQASFEDTTAIRATTPPYVFSHLRRPADDGVRYLQGLNNEEVDRLVTEVTNVAERSISSEELVVAGADLEPRSIDLPPVIVLPYALLPLDETLGVGPLGLILEGAVPDDLLGEALRGWGDDALQVRVDGGDVIFSYAFRGETPGDAQELAAAFRLLLDTRLAEGAYASVRVDEDAVLVLAASDPAVQPRLDELFADFGEEVFLVELG